MTRTTERPGSIQVLVVLGYVSAVLGAVAAVVLFALRNNADLQADGDLTATQIATQAAVLFVLAALTGVLTLLLARGSVFAQVILASVATARLGFALWGLFAHQVHLVTALVEIAVQVVILYLALFHRDTRRFFGEA